MDKVRRKFTAQEKVAILRRHLVDKVPVSDVCEQAGVNPTVFYRWQKEFFENGSAAFERRGGKGVDRQERKLQQKMEAMAAKLVRKDQVMAELLEENLLLKKSLGED